MLVEELLKVPGINVNLKNKSGVTAFKISNFQIYNILKPYIDFINEAKKLFINSGNYQIFKLFFDFIKKSEFQKNFIDTISIYLKSNSVKIKDKKQYFTFIYKGTSKDFYEDLVILMSGQSETFDLDLYKLEAYSKLLNSNLEDFNDFFFNFYDLSGEDLKKIKIEEFSRQLKQIPDHLIDVCKKRNDNIRIFLDNREEFGNIGEFRKIEEIIKIQNEIVEFICSLKPGKYECKKFNVINQNKFF